MLFDEKSFNVDTNNTWAEIDCFYDTMKIFLKIREYDGDLDNIC